MAEFDRTDEGLAVRGPLDAEEEGKFRRQLGLLLDGDTEAVTLDLSGVDFITSACVGSLVAFWIDLRPAGRRLRIVPSPAVRKVLDMTGLSGVFAKAASSKRKAGDAAPGPRGSAPSGQGRLVDGGETGGGQE